MGQDKCSRQREQCAETSSKREGFEFKGLKGIREAGVQQTRGRLVEVSMAGAGSQRAVNLRL